MIRRPSITTPTPTPTPSPSSSTSPTPSPASSTSPTPSPASSTSPTPSPALSTSPTPSPTSSASPTPTPAINYESSPSPSPMSVTPTPTIISQASELASATPTASSGINFGDAATPASSRTATRTPTTNSLPPWIPSGASTTTKTESLNNTVSHNIYAQRSTEQREAKQTDTGSMESTVFDGRPRESDNKKFKGVDRGENGQPQFGPGQSKKGEQRSYVSLNSPGMTQTANDNRMNRHEVSSQYRQSYVDQQNNKGRNVDAIPATYHADVSLNVAERIGNNAIPQEGAKKVPGYQNLDQVSDGHKYKDSYGLAPSSYHELADTTKPGSERIATSSRAAREKLSEHYNPESVVHPSELRTRSEQIEQRRSASKPGNT